MSHHRILIGTFATIAAAIATAQVPDDRAVAALSIDFPGAKTNETAVAVGSDQVMAVYHVYHGGVPAAVEIAYALADPVTGAWLQEGIINSGAIAVGLTDPSVAYDRATGDFLVCAMPLDLASIVVARYSATSGQFSAWQPVAVGVSFDKPWIVAGAAIQPIGHAPAMPSEFYITWHAADGGSKKLHYLRSRDGGFNWVGGLALTNLDDNNSTIDGSLAVPRVYETLPLYVGYRHSGASTIGFVRGDDVNSGVHAGKVRFTKLVDSGGQPIGLVTTLVHPNLYTVTAGPDFVFGGSNPISAPGFDLAVDPTNSGRLYLVYQELDSPTGSDVSVYLRRLIRQSGNVWQLEAPTTIADDPTKSSDDQFMPTMDVDSVGRVHVIYYDDQEFRPGQTDSTFEAKFNLWYAYSTNQGQFWTYWNLCDNPTAQCVGSEPAVDYSVTYDLSLRDYVGIDVGPDGNVWTTFMGMSAVRDPDPLAQETLIWSTRIQW